MPGRLFGTIFDLGVGVARAVIVRAMPVGGFVVAAGLGYQFYLDFEFSKYMDVVQSISVCVLLVWTVGLTSAGLPRLAR
ncbi:MAG: hypothetical protein IIC92_07145 [Chloroflexi bacterium]|nr:hypothetical protein [Chloroflexota bacterium]